VQRTETIDGRDRVVGREDKMSQRATRSVVPGKARWRIGVVVVILVLLSAAMAGCPSPMPPTLAITPTGTMTVMALVAATQEPDWPATWTPTVTFTPWPPTATFTPTATSTPYVPAPACPGPRVSRGPLQIDYELDGKWCPDPLSYYADFTITAKGGDGCYTYYRDIDRIAGPTQRTSVTYRVNWARCGGAPGTFFVESRDGQKAKVLFWVYPPSCCVGYLEDEEE
jgi:hypothetical protein